MVQSSAYLLVGDCDHQVLDLWKGDSSLSILHGSTGSYRPDSFLLLLALGSNSLLILLPPDLNLEALLLDADGLCR